MDDEIDAMNGPGTPSYEIDDGFEGDGEVDNNNRRDAAVGSEPPELELGVAVDWGHHRSRKNETPNCRCRNTCLSELREIFRRWRSHVPAQAVDDLDL